MGGTSICGFHVIAVLSCQKMSVPLGRFLMCANKFSIGANRAVCPCACQFSFAFWFEPRYKTRRGSSLPRSFPPQPSAGF